MCVIVWLRMPVMDQGHHDVGAGQHLYVHCARILSRTRVAGAGRRGGGQEARGGEGREAPSLCESMWCFPGPLS